MPVKVPSDSVEGQNGSTYWASDLARGSFALRSEPLVLLTNGCVPVVLQLEAAQRAPFVKEPVGAGDGICCFWSCKVSGAA